jgi:hypothetical protein
VELYLHSPNTPSWRGAQLKHRDNFTFVATTNARDNILVSYGEIIFLKMTLKIIL